MTGSLEGRRALVTGSTRGIGRAIAIELAAQGANVVVTGRTKVSDREGGAERLMPDGSQRSLREFPGSVEETAAAVRDRGGECLAIAADLCDRPDIERLAAEAVDYLGGLDILVNNAAATGETAVCSFWDPSPDPRWPALTVEHWDRIFALNVTAPFLLTRALAPALGAGGGVIINVTSSAGRLDYSPPPDGEDAPALPGVVNVPLLAYGASKAALDRFSQALAAEALDRGIFSIVLDPGSVATEITLRGAAKHGLDLSRFRPVEIPAKAAAFLADPSTARRYTGRVVRAGELVEAMGL